MSDNQQEQDLAREFSKSVSLAPKKVLFCDAGYGFPVEARPRREKILAVAKQLVNFLCWQSQTQSVFAEVVVIGCDEASQTAVEERMVELLKGDVPDNFRFSSQSLESLQDSIYLSPDAEETLDANTPPPDRLVVGLLIDRRIQLNRSKNRATKLGLPSARLPLENFNVDDSEPLNVDTVLTAVQQWWWNCETMGASSECFLDSMEQAFQEHYLRHPNRPLHKEPNKSNS
mmetsp:Transcript_22633/g.37434  ORF Transcript_22633/g.37434 Transcript_22633/m.37434 type:complete len:230 (-) Transcript_22633:24-713(-)|eukprot:CAMPEP_0119004664 /NCGR_PEP_ID=MMETSP1176-20130426/1283_1 /TAXON_ID=265551 /ORGANISM="Synedropsis recta cf, Strain CCMP1620" /LENGTH=229 /DNA_ID=CAMNT_0006956399 /DNA_START=40 /DNA_END=729 /DNA_ORIENTATION=+